MRPGSLLKNLTDWLLSLAALPGGDVSNDGLEPLRGWVIGRIAITRASGTIAIADPNKNVTKFALIEAVSPEARLAGFYPGQLVMAKTMHNIFLRGGTYHRVTFPTDEVVCRADVSLIPLSEFIGTDGKPLVSEAA